MKILIIAGLIFGSVVGLLFCFFALLFIGIRFGELMDDIEMKYGLKGSLVAFLIDVAILSLIVATILTLTGV